MRSWLLGTFNTFCSFVLSTSYRPTMSRLISCVSSPCRVCGAGASSPSVQPLHPGVQPASSPVRRSGEERLAAEEHRGAGGGTQLPALSAGPLHRQHEESGRWGVRKHIRQICSLNHKDIKTACSSTREEKVEQSLYLHDLYDFIWNYPKQNNAS